MQLLNVLVLFPLTTLICSSVESGSIYCATIAAYLVSMTDPYRGPNVFADMLVFKFVVSSVNGQIGVSDNYWTYIGF